MQLGDGSQRNAKKYRHDMIPGHFPLNCKAGTVDPKIIGVSEQILSGAIDMVCTGKNIAEGNKRA